MTTRDTPEAVAAAALDVTLQSGKGPLRMSELAAAILAALDREGGALMTVPSPGESAGHDREQRQEAEIARLRKGALFVLAELDRLARQTEAMAVNNAVSAEGTADNIRRCADHLRAALAPREAGE